jgi:alkanesulfonate monooxygenase SsuD/methylene tetrahydromethanopterin reductase-like flavin-dependent oxidoreductase (luciferase family)
VTLVEFFMFHLMPYPHLPADFDDYETSWLTYPNRHYDPHRGHLLYNQYLDQLEYAEELGFDGVCVNEHHQTTYGTIPAPNVMAAFLARATSRVKIAIVGNALPLRDHPLRVAEEVAVLDVVTGGRIISGFVRGIGVEYFTFGLDPTTSRERFNEAHDLIVKAWTEREPFSWTSKHYRFRYVNVWPRPIQQPHPPVWVPGYGSTETLDWVAEHRYTFMSVYAPTALTRRWLDGVRDAAQRHGYEADPRQIGALFPIYVAETEREAHAHAEQHLLWLFRKGLKHKLEYLFPPGYLSPGSMKGMMLAGLKPFGEYTYRELLDEGYAVAGTPDQVTERLSELHDVLGFGTLAGLLHFGDMPHERTLRSMELFAREVMPAMRDRVPVAA